MWETAIRGGSGRRCDDNTNVDIRKVPYWGQRVGSLLSFSRMTLFFSVRYLVGRTIAQEMNRWLSIAATRVQSLFSSRGILGGRSCTGACFLRVDTSAYHVSSQPIKCSILVILIMVL